MSNQSSIRGRVLMTSSLAVLGLAISGLGNAALAQQTGAQSSGAPAPEIVVTGSRIVRRDFTASSPIVTIQSETLENQSNVGIEVGLNKLPQFSPANGQVGLDTTNVQPGATTSPGISTVGLRGLGPNRTLVLVDGRRVQPANASLEIDVNTIPAAAIQSVEVVTGGASAVYGADAVAGVVNFKLKQNFQGVEVDGQYGQSQYGDDNETTLSALVGGNFGDSGNNNVMFGLNFAQRGSVLQKDRDFYTKAFADTGTPTPFGPAGFINWAQLSPISFLTGAFQPPSQNAVNCVFSGDTSAGTGDPACPFVGKGVPSGAVGGFIFSPADFAVNPDGTVFDPFGVSSGGNFYPAPGYTGPQGVAHPVGDNVFKIITGGQDHGDLEEIFTGSLVSFPLTRYSAFTQAHYDVNDWATLYMQGSYSKTRTSTTLAQSPAINFWAVEVPHDAAHPVPAELEYLLNNRVTPGPPAVPGGLPTAIPVAPGASWQLDQNTFTGPRHATETGDTYQVTLGVKGKLPIMDWTYDLYGTHGETSLVTDFDSGWVVKQKLQAVVDAPNYGQGFVATNGQAIATPGFGGTCTSGLGPTIFSGGAIKPSQDCIDLITARMKSLSELRQEIMELDFQGGLFDIPWGGEVRFAVGADYRQESYKYIPDDTQDEQSFLQQPVGIFGGNEAIGSTSVNEGYGELSIPILKDLPLVKSFEINPGYRFSDYDTAGGVDTYKAIGNWTVVDWFAIRGGYQKATRAPNIAELFTGAAQTVNGGLGDPCSVNFLQNWGVNPVTNTNPVAVANVAKLCHFFIDPVAPGAYDPTTYQGLFGGNFPLKIDIVTGNPNVKPESATTWTAGVTIKSPWQTPLLSRFQASIDWYSIKVSNAINVALGEISYEQCFNADGKSNPAFANAASTGAELAAGNPFCSFIRREALTGFDRNELAPYTNFGGVKTKGVDFQLDWSADLDDMLKGTPGSVSANIVANMLTDYLVQASPTGKFLDFAGTTGNVTTGGAQFDYKLTTTVTYSVGPAAVSLRWIHLPALTNVNKVANPTTTILGPNDYDLFDLFGTWKLGDHYELRAGIDNLLDADPQVTSPTAPNPGVNNGLGITMPNYDQIGRRFFFGAKMKF